MTAKSAAGCANLFRHLIYRHHLCSLLICLQRLGLESSSIEQYTVQRGVDKIYNSLKMPNKKIFVTVGTTKFDDLINTVTSDEVLKELSKKGYNQLTLQIGKTDLEPDCTPRLGFNHIEAFHLSPSLNEAMKSADLIISHAGAGSCLEALELFKPLIVVTNDLLMNNHQVELAEQLYKDGHLYYCNCRGLCELVQNMDLTKLIPFNGNKSHIIANVIDTIMGFS